MNARRVAAAAGVILAAQKTKNTATGIAVALESACLLQSPESAAEAAQLNDDVTGACLARYEEEQDNARLRLALASAKRGRRELRTRLEAFEALELGTPEGRVSAKCEIASHPVWLRDLDDVRGCPWCRVAELEALTPARFQDCRVCGTGYEYGQPCSYCEFKKRMAAETGSYRSTPLPPGEALCATCGHNGAAHHHAGTACWADIPKRLGEAIRLCPCKAFTGGTS